MKSHSLTVNAASIDTLVYSLKRKYGDCLEIVPHAKGSKLIVVEKYYFRSNSNALGVVLIETTGEGEFLVNIIAGGAASGILGIGWGAEDQFLDEMKKTLLSVQETTETNRRNR